MAPHIGTLVRGYWWLLSGFWRRKARVSVDITDTEPLTIRLHFTCPVESVYLDAEAARQLGVQLLATVEAAEDAEEEAPVPALTLVPTSSTRH